MIRSESIGLLSFLEAAGTPLLLNKDIILFNFKL
jgi:hypothetical protein